MTCRNQLYLDGKVTPRRCEECGQGPCLHDVVTIKTPTAADQVNEILGEAAALASQANAVLDKLAAVTDDDGNLVADPRALAEARVSVENSVTSVRHSVAPGGEA